MHSQIHLIRTIQGEARGIVIWYYVAISCVDDHYSMKTRLGASTLLHSISFLEPHFGLKTIYSSFH